MKAIKTNKELSVMKSAELKNICKKMGITGYSKLNVTKLIEAITGQYLEILSKSTNSDMRRFLTAKGAVGIAKTTKGDLVDMILGNKPIKGLVEVTSEPVKASASKKEAKITTKPISTTEEDSYENMTVSELRKLCADKGLSRYSKANKPTLIGMLNSSEEPEENFDNVIDISTDDSDIEDTSVEEESNPNTITVINGARTRIVELQENDTIWTVHERMRGEMSIISNPSFSVNNTTVGNTYIFQPGDKVEFFAPNGNKG